MPQPDSGQGAGVPALVQHDLAVDEHPGKANRVPLGVLGGTRRREKRERVRSSFARFEAFHPVFAIQTSLCSGDGYSIPYRCSASSRIMFTNSVCEMPAALASITMSLISGFNPGSGLISRIYGL